jgi:DNA repair protein RadC
MILFRAVPRRDSKPLAKAVLAKFDSFAEALNAPDERLREVPGLGEAAITEIKLVRAAALPLVRGQLLEQPVLRLVESGAPLLPRLDGLRGQGAVPHALETAALTAEQNVCFLG